VSVLQRLREKFWFIPALLSVAAFVLAEALVALDRQLGEMGGAGLASALLTRTAAAGSRDLLGVIATSSLAVAGTTFSITIAVMALTSSSYGPRLVRNFMADSGNQLVLGVYVATFLYSLLVMRSIRVELDGQEFVPHLAVTVALLLAVLNVAVLVYFIHHISDSIQIATIAARVRSDLRDTAERRYPAAVGRDLADISGDATGIELPARLDQDGVPVRAGAPGYVQSVRSQALMAAARRHDVLVAMRVQPGDYVLDATALALLHPPERATDDVADDIRASVVIGAARSPQQDVEFAVQQLTELAVRALSTGTNDPYTAVNALDELSAGLVVIASHEDPSTRRFDKDEVLRVHAPHRDAIDLVSSVLDRMRWYAASSIEVMGHALALVEQVGRATESRPLRARLLTQVTLMVEAVARAEPQPHDMERFRQRADEVVRGLARD
jgi:uncharacterized membrane protein